MGRSLSTSVQHTRYVPSSLLVGPVHESSRAPSLQVTSDSKMKLVGDVKRQAGIPTIDKTTLPPANDDLFREPTWPVYGTVHAFDGVKSTYLWLLRQGPTKPLAQGPFPAQSHDGGFSRVTTAPQRARDARVGAIRAMGPTHEKHQTKKRSRKRKEKKGKRVFLPPMMAVCAVHKDTTCALSAKVSWGARGSLVCGGGAMHLFTSVVWSVQSFFFPFRIVTLTPVTSRRRTDFH